MIGWSLMKTHLVSAINTNKTDIEDWKGRSLDLSLVSKIKLDDISVHYFHSLASPICVLSKQKAISFFLCCLSNKLKGDFIMCISITFFSLKTFCFLAKKKKEILSRKRKRRKKSSKRNRKSLLSQLWIFLEFVLFFSGKKIVWFWWEIYKRFSIESRWWKEGNLNN